MIEQLAGAARGGVYTGATGGAGLRILDGIQCRVERAGGTRSVWGAMKREGHVPVHLEGRRLLTPIL